MSRLWASLTPPAGLIFGPAMWAANTQLADMLPDLECHTHMALLGLSSLIAVVVTALGGLLSWQHARQPSAAYAVSQPFVAHVSALVALIFAFALLLQGASSLVISGCQH